jgi:hypothetical protein
MRREGHDAGPAVGGQSLDPGPDLIEAGQPLDAGLPTPVELGIVIDQLGQLQPRVRDLLLLFEKFAFLAREQGDEADFRVNRAEPTRIVL